MRNIMSLKKQARHISPRCIWHAITPMLAASGLLLMSMRVEANLPSGFIDFTGTLLEVTCDISATPTVNLGDLDVTPILTNPNGWATVGSGAIDVRIAGCQGASSARTPGIALSGQLSTDPGVTANNSLFKTGGGSKGFGIVVSYNNARLSQGSVVNINPSAGTTVRLMAAVSGGEKAWAGTQNQNMTTGTLTASVTFTFGYR